MTFQPRKASPFFDPSAVVPAAAKDVRGSNAVASWDADLTTAMIKARIKIEEEEAVAERIIDLLGKEPLQTTCHKRRTPPNMMPGSERPVGSSTDCMHHFTKYEQASGLTGRWLSLPAQYVCRFRRATPVLHDRDG